MFGLAGSAVADPGSADYFVLCEIRMGVSCSESCSGSIEAARLPVCRPLDRVMAHVRRPSGVPSRAPSLERRLDASRAGPSRGSRGGERGSRCDRSERSRSPAATAAVRRSAVEEPGEQRLTRRRVQCAQDASSQSRRMTVRQSLTGDKICVPGVSTLRENWTIPASYDVASLLGVLVLKVGDDGSVDSEGERFRISGVLMSSGSAMAPRSLTVGECEPAKDEVQVLFGPHVLEFVPAVDVVGRECADVDGVSTPRTPSPSGRSDG